MNADEALHLCRLAKSLCPQMAMDEFTPEAWGLALHEETFKDAKDALVRIIRRETFIDIAKIVAEVKAIRRDRLMRFGPVPPPPELADRPHEENEWMRAIKARVADGTLDRAEFDATQPVLKMRNVAGVLAGTFRTIPSEDGSDPWATDSTEEYDPS